MPSPILLAALAALLSDPTAPAEARQAPPGTVLVRGGDTRVGSTEAEVLDLIAQDPQGRPALWAREYPQHESRVGDFFAMVTEVTNEQYLEFVKASGAKPPEHWAFPAIDARQAAYNLEQGELKAAAKERGATHEIAAFDRSAWWSDHWRGAPWQFPTELARHPVVYVDYAEAAAYARWAGLRLPTEEEFQRACRGDTAYPYPWGSAFEPKKYAHTSENGVVRTYAVGSFPAGAREGLYDLCGSVWEWTATPFEAYPKYAPLELVARKAGETVRQYAVVEFDADDRVAVGGSFQSTRLESRATVRRRCDRTASTEALGFRCVASTAPGRDLAEAVLRADLRADVLPEGVAYAAAAAVTLDHWVARAAPTAAEPRPTDPDVPGYQVIAGYEHMLFVPVTRVMESHLKSLAETSVKQGPVHLGMLSTSLDIVDPPLAAGVYLLAYRGPGGPRKQAGSAPGAGEDVRRIEKSALTHAAPQDEAERTGDALDALELDPEQPNLIVYDADGTPILALPAPELTYESQGPGQVAVENLRYTAEELTKDPSQRPADVVTFTVTVPGQSSSKGFRLTLHLEVRAKATQGWRY